MRKLPLLALVPTLLLWTGAAQAQSEGDYGSSSMPSIILPEQLTSPITGDFNPADGGPPQNAEGPSAEGGESWQQPYSAPGEETLDPETN